MDNDRRGLLKVLTAALGASAAGSVGGPILGALVGPARTMTVRTAEGFVAVASLESIPSDAPIAVDVWVERPMDAWSALPRTRVGSVFLLRQGDAVTAFASACPHLGCRVEITGNSFACPCHDSVFDPSGKVVKGPSPRGLDVLDSRIREGHVEVLFQRFRSGSHEKVPA